MKHIDAHWDHVKELLGLDGTDPAWTPKYQTLRAAIRRGMEETSCVEQLFLDAYTDYMLAPRSGTDVASGVDPRRVEALLTAVLVLEPEHTGAAMTLAHLRYDQQRPSDALELFRQTRETSLEGERRARRLEMIAACQILLNDGPAALLTLHQLAEYWRTLSPHEYEPLQLSFLVSSLARSAHRDQIQSLEAALLELDAIGDFTWFADELAHLV